MRDEYDFRGKEGARGKHYKAMREGYITIIHKSDGSTVVKEGASNSGGFMAVIWEITNRMPMAAKITMKGYLKQGDNRQTAEDDVQATTSKFTLQPNEVWFFEFLRDGSKPYYKLTLESGEFKARSSIRRRTELLLEFYSNDNGWFDILEAVSNNPSPAEVS